MKQEKLNLYQIDIKYIRNLHHIDDRVPSISPQIGKHGKLLGVLNYNLLIPVTEHQLIKLNLKSSPNDSPQDRFYKQLCIDELTWCQKNSEIIINKANCLYHLCTSESNYKGKNRCLDFQRLEKECEKYTANTTGVRRK